MLKKLGIILAITGLGLVSNVAWANNQAKIATLKKAYKVAKYSQYASVDLKKLIQEFNYLEKKYIDFEENPLGCEVAEHYDMGLGNDPDTSNLKIKYTILSNGDVKAEWKEYNGGKTSVVYKMTCKGSKCEINDIISHGQSNKDSYRKLIQQFKTKGTCY